MDYMARQRHLLLDMHIPGWDEAFLRDFDPAAAVRFYLGTGADAVMLYANSHMGLDYWPTSVGTVHPGIGGRDVFGETTRLLRKAGVAVCAYYSMIFNNQAYLDRPEWRIVPVDPNGAFGPNSRYGVCCPANMDYVAFMVAEVEELARSYEFDSLFVDMPFWPDICVCDTCRERLRTEEGIETPQAVDWLDPDWVRFVDVRRRWLAEAYGALTEATRRHQDVPVWGNSIGTFAGWRMGPSDWAAQVGNMIGGDYFAEGIEWLVFASRARQRSPGAFQYMKAVSLYGGGDLMSLDRQLLQALQATLLGGQFQIIDGVQPGGALHADVYERAARVFAAIKPYEEYLGGDLVADVAVYTSLDAAGVDFADNGTALSASSLAVLAGGRTGLHDRAVSGAAAALMEAHLPTTVISSADLDRLSDFSVVVVPNLTRITKAEINAFRRYVECGGKLYASGWTSLVGVDAVRHANFGLADLFGCSFTAALDAAVTYITPVEPTVASWLPRPHLVHGAGSPLLSASSGPITTMSIEPNPGVDVLATYTLPYGEGRGTRDDQTWSSIHHSSPWRDTDRAAIVRNRVGEGQVIYSGADFETHCSPPGPSPAARSLLVNLVLDLLVRAPSYSVEADPVVWTVAFRDPGSSRLRINLLNTGPGCQHGIRLRISAPDGAAFVALRSLPGGDEIPFRVEPNGDLNAEIVDLQLFMMLSAEYSR